MKQTQEPAKKQAILEAATQLMLDKGYVATSVDEICTQAGVTKGSFFYYFKSKEDLGKALVRCFGARHQTMIEQQLVGINDPLDRIYAYLDFIIEMSHNCSSRGCLIGTFTQELHASHPDITSLCSENFHLNCELLKAELVAAREKYSPQMEIDVDGLAEAFMALTQGTMILIKAHSDCAIMARTLNHYRNYLKGLFRR